MLLLYLTHAFIVFGSCSYCIWLMLLLYLAHALPWISVMRIWVMRIFLSLKKRMSQGPAVCHFLKPETNFRLYFELIEKSCRGRHHSEQTSANFILMVVTRAISNFSKNHTFLMCRM
jgi:hypothetical protein